LILIFLCVVIKWAPHLLIGATFSSVLLLTSLLYNYKKVMFKGSFAG
jgi:hypothetical protein